MILADTNIIIDFWNKPTATTRKVFAENDIAICGVIKTELLRGSTSESQFSQMENALSCLSYLAFSEEDWPLLARQFITLKQTGLVVPFQDAMIAYLAIKYNCEVWTGDRHFKLMQSAMSNLKLFDSAKAAKSE